MYCICTIQLCRRCFRRDGKQTLWVVSLSRLYCIWLSNFVKDVFQGFKFLYIVESKLCGLYNYWGCIVFALSNFVKDVIQGMKSNLCGSYIYRDCLIFVLFNFVEDIFQGFKIEITSKANFGGRSTVEIVLYLHYPTLWVKYQ